MQQSQLDALYHLIYSIDSYIKNEVSITINSTNSTSSSK